MQAQVLDVSFPTLPPTLERVEALIASGRTDPEELIGIVKRCPSTSVNVLRRANSAYYGLRHDVESVEQAVRLLGFLEVSSIVVLESANEMREQLTNYTGLLDRILRASIFNGRFTQQLTCQIDLADEWMHLAFSVGLIHTMGRLVLLYSAPDRYQALTDAQDAPLPAADDEHRLFGESHRALALRASKHWGLSDRICAVLDNAIDLSDPADNRRQTVAIALRMGSALALQNLAGVPFALPEDLPPAEPTFPEEIVAVAAEDATEYAAALEGF